MIVLSKDQLARNIVNFTMSPEFRPKDVEIIFIDVNGIELSGVAKVIIKSKDED